MRRFAIVSSAAALVGLGVFIAPASHASGVTHWVNDDQTLAAAPGTSCTHPGYRNIQDAVDAASPADVINVCPGTYAEQVRVESAAKNNISLRSTQPWAAIIKAPALMTPPFSIVQVNAAQGVGVLGFTITGPGPAPCASIDAGVLVNFGGSADILGNHITKIRDSAFGGCQNGNAIQIGSYTLSGGVSTPGRGDVKFNLIDNYQKSGVVVNEPGSYARVQANRVIGAGPTPIIAQNGVQVGYFAAADVLSNVISGNSYTGASGDESAGILLTDLPRGPGGAVTVAGNDVSRNDDGIYLTGTDVPPDPTIGYGPTTGQKVLSNRSHDNRFDGLFADSATSRNDIRSNKAERDGRYDCHDESPPGMQPATTNFWRDNTGRTMNKPKLCRPESHDDHGHGGGYGGGGHGDDDDDHGDDHGRKFSINYALRF